MAGHDVVHWFRHGASTPVVLLHGFTGAVASWQGVVDALGHDSVLGLHLPGHHPAAPVAVGWDANIDWIARVLQDAGVKRCRLVGYSLGARAGLGVVLRHPGLVEDATLIGVHPGLASDTARADRRAADARWAERLRSQGIEAFVSAWEALPIFATQSPAARAAQRPIRLSHDPAALAASLEHMGLGQMPDYRRAFAAATTPIRFAVGERDDKFSRLARQLVAGPHIIAGCGHNPVVEEPAAVAALI